MTVKSPVALAPNAEVPCRSGGKTTTQKATTTCFKHRSSTKVMTKTVQGPFWVAFVLALIACEAGLASGIAQFKATMKLFEDSGYTRVLSSPRLKTSQQVYVQVETDLSSNGVKLVLEQCWSTPSPQPSDPNKLFLIRQPGCATNSVPMRVTVNGQQRYANFNHQVFKYHTSPTITTHCTIAVCVGNCAPSCSKRRRKRRQAASNLTEETETISATFAVELDEAEPHELLPTRSFTIPTRPERNSTTEAAQTELAEGLDSTTLVVIIGALAAAVLLAGVTVCVVLHCRLKKAKETKERKQRNVDVYAIVHPAYAR